MTSFEDRQKGFEGKFAHNEALEFKAQARRNKLIAHWAGEKMGLAGVELDEYTREVIKADFEEAGDDDVFRKLRADLDARKVEVSDHQLRREMEELLVEARRQVEEEA